MRASQEGCAVQNSNPDVLHTNWQVSIMHADKHREYTYCVLDFTYPDGRPYQTKKRLLQGDVGMEEASKNIQLKILDSDEVRMPWLRLSRLCEHVRTSARFSLSAG